MNKALRWLIISIGVDVSTYTLLTQALHANSGQEVLVDHLAQSMPGEEAVIFNQIPDGNGGQPLPANALFGEAVAGTSIILTATTMLTGARAAEPEIRPAPEAVTMTAPGAAPDGAEA